MEGVDGPFLNTVKLTCIQFSEHGPAGGTELGIGQNGRGTFIPWLNMSPAALTILRAEYQRPHVFHSIQSLSFYLAQMRDAT